MNRLSSLFLFICFTCQIAFAAEKEAIQWMAMDWPPAYILEGEWKGKGVFDLGLQLLIEEMGEYDHNIVVSPLARTKREAKKGVPVCYYGPIYSQEYADQNRFVLSMPISLSPPQQIAILKKNRHLFGSGKSVSLKNLLTRKESEENLRLGVVNSWKYGEAVDGILEQYGDPGRNLVKRSGNDASTGLVKMLLAERIHYIPLYPVVFRWLVTTNKYPSDQFEMIPVEEYKGEYSMGAVGCTHSPWGLKMIKRINEALLNLRKNPAFYKSLEHWFPPKGQEAQYRQQYVDKLLPATTGFIPADIPKKQQVGSIH